MLWSRIRRVLLSRRRASPCSDMFQESCRYSAFFALKGWFRALACISAREKRNSRSGIDIYSDSINICVFLRILLGDSCKTRRSRLGCLISEFLLFQTSPALGRGRGRRRRHARGSSSSSRRRRSSLWSTTPIPPGPVGPCSTRSRSGARRTAGAPAPRASCRPTRKATGAPLPAPGQF